MSFSLNNQCQWAKCDNLPERSQDERSQDERLKLCKQHRLTHLQMTRTYKDYNLRGNAAYDRWQGDPSCRISLKSAMAINNIALRDRIEAQKCLRADIDRAHMQAIQVLSARKLELELALAGLPPDDSDKKSRASMIPSLEALPTNPFTLLPGSTPATPASSTTTPLTHPICHEERFASADWGITDSMVAPTDSYDTDIDTKRTSARVTSLSASVDQYARATGGISIQTKHASSASDKKDKACKKASEESKKIRTVTPRSKKNRRNVKPSRCGALMADVSMFLTLIFNLR